MPDFTYEALANTGSRSQGTLSANSEREVMTMLDARGLFPLRIEMVKESAARAVHGTGKVKAKYTSAFFAQMADLLRAGVPLLRSLQILEKQTTLPTMQVILREIHAKVADGTSLADAMGEHPRAFGELAVSMVRAGQEGGFLEDVLERIAAFTENQEDLKSKVIGALAYPAFLAIMGLIVLNVLVIFFVPKFEPVFKKLEEKGELPGLTVFLIGLSHFMRNYSWVLILGALGLIFLFRQWIRTESGRFTLDTWRLRIPVVGNIYLQLALSRFTRILGTLLKNGIPILQSLRIAKDSAGNKVLTQAIDQAADNVTTGKTLAGPLSVCPYFPRDVIEMITVGEESNMLEKVLIDIANALEKRTSRQLELFVRLLEPMMLLVMAGFTLVVVLGLLLPVFKMSSTIG